MPIKINPADRKLLLITGAAFVLLVVIVAFLTPGEGTVDETVPSTYSSAPGGARAAFLLLQETGFPVQRWEDSPVDLPPDPGGSLLILADPAEEPNQAERESIRHFVELGGRIIFTGPAVRDFFSEARLFPQRFEFQGQPKVFRALIPSLFTRDAPTVTFRPLALWNRIEGSQIALYGDPRRPAVVSWRIGKGELIWWAAATPLTNAEIAKEGNLNLLLDAVSEDAAISNAPVAKIYWDEYFHGERSSIWASIAKTPLLWGFAQLILLASAFFFTFARRDGPIQPAVRSSRLWPLEFVDTMGALYERAGATSAAVDAVYRSFRAALTRRLQLEPTAPDPELAAAVESRLGWYHPDLKQTLSRAAAVAHGEKITPAGALAIVQKLEYCRQELEFKRTQSKERV